MPLISKLAPNNYAAHDADFFRAGGRDLDGLWIAAVAAQFRTHTVAADVSLFLHRYVNDAKHRLLVFDERDVDGEFTIAIDEFFCAIQGVDQPK